MKIFVVHVGDDYNIAIFIKSILEYETNSDVLILDKKKLDNEKILVKISNFINGWKKEARKEIKNSQLILVLLNKSMKDNPNVKWEIVQAKNYFKQIYCLDIEPYRGYLEKNNINETLKQDNIIEAFNEYDKTINNSFMLNDLPKYLIENDKYTNSEQIYPSVKKMSSITQVVAAINNYNFDNEN